MCHVKKDMFHFNIIAQSPSNVMSLILHHYYNRETKNEIKEFIGTNNEKKNTRMKNKIKEDTWAKRNKNILEYTNKFKQ